MLFLNSINVYNVEQASRLNKMHVGIKKLLEKCDEKAASMLNTASIATL